MFRFCIGSLNSANIVGNIYTVQYIQTNLLADEKDLGADSCLDYSSKLITIFCRSPSMETQQAPTVTQATNQSITNNPTIDDVRITT